MESLAVALLLASFAELRLAVHRIDRRLSAHEAHESKRKGRGAVAAGLLVAVAVLLLAGCGGARPLTPGPGLLPGSVGAALAGPGSWVVWAGTACLVLGVLLGVARLFGKAPVSIVVVLELLASGAALIACGASVLWLAAHPWAIAGSLGLGAGYLAWRYWPRLRRLLSRPPLAHARPLN